MCSSKSLVNILKSAHNHRSDNLRNESQFQTRPVRTEYFGRQSLMYLGPKIWKLPRTYEIQKLLQPLNIELKTGNQKNVLVGSARLIQRKLVFFKSFCFHLLNKFNFNILVLLQFVLEKSFGNNEYHREIGRWTFFRQVKALVPITTDFFAKRRLQNQLYLYSYLCYMFLFFRVDFNQLFVNSCKWLLLFLFMYMYFCQL